MKAAVVVDGHLGKTKDGLYWSSGIYDYDFFKRYLNVFDEIRVIIRIEDIDTNEGYPNLCSGDGIEFHKITEYRGPKEFINKYYKIRKEIKNSFIDCNCAILRVPSNIGFMSLKHLKKMKIPYSIEVVIDPWDFAAPGTMKTLFRPLVRVTWTRNLKKACLSANGVSYVTKYALQKRYPSYVKKYGEDSTHFESSYSSVNLPEWFFGSAKKYEKLDKLRIVHVANTISNKLKGHEELILAVKKLEDQGLITEVDFIGDGPWVIKFKELIENLGIVSQINFVGRISIHNELRKCLLENDIMVFPTHAEGLPRALIEAMAVGLPCISTDINGIPELLEKDFLVNIGDVDSVANKLKNLINNPSLLSQASIRNIIVAQEYSENILKLKRSEFYTKLKGISQLLPDRM